MPRKSTSGNRSIELAIAQFLAEFARSMLAAGVTYPKFADLARAAFFEAASGSATFRNQRINLSAVAAMTGLTRTQARELVKKEKRSSTKADRVDHLIEGWTNDPEFLKGDFSPRRLRIGAKTLGFSELVRRYGGDIPPRATLREMIRKRFVTIHGQYVQLDPKVRESKAQARLRHVSNILAAMIMGPRSDLDPPSHVRTLRHEVTYSGTSPKGRILLQKRSAESLRALLSELQAAGTAASLESPPIRKRGSLTTRTRVVLISEDFNSTDGP